METRTFNPEKIIARLQFFNYPYDFKGTTLKIFFPWQCYLKIKFASGSVKMTASVNFGGFYLPTIEYNFLIYGLVFFLVATWMPFQNISYAILYFLGLNIIYFVICIIKIESLRSIVHSWIEKDAVS